MNDIFIIRRDVDMFWWFKGDIDTIDSLKGDIDNKMVV